MLLKIDFVDEICIAGEDDDKNEVSHEREIDEIQDADNDFLPGRTPQVRQHLIELYEGLVDEKKNTSHQNQEERRRQPPRNENRLLWVMVGPDHDFLPSSKCQDGSIGQPVACGLRGSASLPR